MDDHRLSFDEALDITKNMVNYTNHTVLSEALEKWSEELIQRKLPRIYMIIKQIDQRFCDETKCLGVSNEELNNLRIIHNGEVRMANMCVIASGKVNGVSALHTDIIKNRRKEENDMKMWL